MKKYFCILLALILLPLPAFGANYFWWATGLTGGGSALDGIDGNSITTGDAAAVVYDDGGTAKIAFYRCYESGATESSPSVITPDANAGSKRWHLSSGYLTNLSTVATDDPYVGIIPSTSGESYWYLGVNNDSVGDDNDPLEFRQSATAGSSVRASLATSGNFTLLGSLLPLTAGTPSLGSATNEWLNLYLYDGAVIYGQANQGNTLTSSVTGWTANLLFSGTGGFSARAASGLYLYNSGTTFYTLLRGLDTQVANNTVLVGKTFTDTKWCNYSTTSGLNCNQDAPAGSGDVTDVGDCASGACYSGAAGTGTYLRLYDGSTYSAITAGTRSFVFSSSVSNSESISLTLGANDNTATVSTTTGVTDLSLSAINLATTGNMTGGVARIGTFAAPITTNPYTMAAANCYGHVLFYGATGEIDLPAAVAGMTVLIYNTGAFTVTIDPNGSDVIVREGTAQTGGVSMTLSSGSGNFVVLFADAANHWVTLGSKGTLAQGS